MKQANHSVQATLHANPDAVWELIGSGKNVDKWLPIITSCRVEGNKRYCADENGTFEEDILKVDHKNRIFEYAIPEQHIMPVEDIRGSMKVKAINENTAIVSWTWNFRVDSENENEVKEGLTMVGNMGLKGIENYVNAVAV